MKKHLLTFIVLSLFATCAWSQSMSPIGTWVNEEGKARFEIYACSDKLCGKIVSLKEPLKDGKPKVDENNMWDEGTIYDPESGKTYSCYMKMLGEDKMEVKGYIGISLIGRSQNWTRIK